MGKVIFNEKSKKNLLAGFIFLGSVTNPFHFDTAPDPFRRHGSGSNLKQKKIPTFVIGFFRSDYPKKDLLLYKYLSQSDSLKKNKSDTRGHDSYPCFNTKRHSLQVWPRCLSEKYCPRRHHLETTSYLFIWKEHFTCNKKRHKYYKVVWLAFISLFISK